MKVAVFSTKPHDRDSLAAANIGHGHELAWLEPRLTRETATLARGYEAVCVFVHDRVDRAVVATLAAGDVALVALRCAGFNNVDVRAAADHGIAVARVPAYSPYAVAEHTIGLILTLDRKFHRAFARVREGNFALEGLLGFDLRGKTVGVIGTGRIGAHVVRILAGFESRVLAHDLRPDPACAALGAEYVPLGVLLARADIITLHCPLTPRTHHLIGARALDQMKRGAILVNTSRGGLLDARAAVTALKQGRLGGLGLDVYEEEADLFYEDLSNRVIQDDVFARLLTFPNVVITAHQAFFTVEAVSHIADTTIANLTDYARGRLRPENEVSASLIQPPPAAHSGEAR